MAITTKWEEGLNENSFNYFEDTIYPIELRSLILNDEEIKAISRQSKALSKRYYERVEELRIANNLEYQMGKLPKWAKDLKIMKVYTKEDTAGSESDCI